VSSDTEARIGAAAKAIVNPIPMGRTGYRGFVSFIWVLFKFNRAANKLGISSKIEITLPLRWLR
jgi:hypothetical protein